MRMMMSNWMKNPYVRGALTAAATLTLTLATACSRPDVSGTSSGKELEGRGKGAALESSDAGDRIGPRFKQIGEPGAKPPGEMLAEPAKPVKLPKKEEPSGK